MSFLQTPEWAEIQERDGRKSHRISYGSEVVWLYEHPLPYGFKYLYGPRVSITNADQFLHQMKAYARPYGPIFLRLEPEVDLRFTNQDLRIERGANLQPQRTVMLDLKKSNEELLASMHPKTRYNIKVAERHGIRVETRAGMDALDDFYGRLEETAARDGFRLHPKSHYAHLLASNSHQFENCLFFAYYQGELAAVALLNFYGEVATYLHGASTYSLRSFMAPYMIHWEMIKEARRRGVGTYDFWGIDEDKWPGVTRFKRGWGGEEVSYPEAFQIIFRPASYRLYSAVSSFRRGIRKLWFK